MGSIRHLRIANSYDPITLGPPFSTQKFLTLLNPAANILSTVFNSNNYDDETYTHVGIILKLTRRGEKFWLILNMRLVIGVKTF